MTADDRNIILMDNALNSGETIATIVHINKIIIEIGIIVFL